MAFTPVISAKISEINFVVTGTQELPALTGLTAQLLGNNIVPTFNAAVSGDIPIDGEYISRIWDIGTPNVIEMNTFPSGSTTLMLGQMSADGLTIRGFFQDAFGGSDLYWLSATNNAFPISTTYAAFLPAGMNLVFAPNGSAGTYTHPVINPDYVGVFGFTDDGIGTISVSMITGNDIDGPTMFDAWEMDYADMPQVFTSGFPALFNDGADYWYWSTGGGANIKPVFIQFTPQAFGSGYVQQNWVLNFDDPVFDAFDLWDVIGRTADTIYLYGRNSAVPLSDSYFAVSYDGASYSAYIPAVAGPSISYPAGLYSVGGDLYAFVSPDFGTTYLVGLVMPAAGEAITIAQYPYVKLPCVTPCIPLIKRSR